MANGRRPHLPRFGRTLVGFRREAVDAALLRLERKAADAQSALVSRQERATERLAEAAQTGLQAQQRLDLACQCQQELLDQLHQIEVRGHDVTARATAHWETEEAAVQRQIDAVRARLGELNALWYAARQDALAVLSFYQFLLSDDPAQARSLSPSGADESMSEGNPQERMGGA